jgi:GNAT superfamily N-acetyltransferase
MRHSLLKVRLDQEKLFYQMLAEVPVPLVQLTDLSIAVHQPLIKQGWLNRPGLYYLAENAHREIVAAIGYASWNNQREIPQLRIAVQSSYRGRGIGTELMEQFMDGLRRKGYPQLMLTVGRNSSTVYWFGRMGFEIVSEKDNWLVMRKQMLVSA